jgi:hypothetical protein
MARTSCIRWDNDDVGILLDQHTYLDLYSASPQKKHSVCRHVASFLFRVNQSLFLLLNVVCLAEKQQIINSFYKQYNCKHTAYIYILYIHLWLQTKIVMHAYYILVCIYTFKEYLKLLNRLCKYNLFNNFKYSL